MKTYSKLLNGSALTLITLFLLCSVDASASAPSNGLEVPAFNGVTEEVSAPPSTLQIVNLIPFEYNGNVNIRCHGTNTGRATVEVTGGVPPYSYSWSAGTAMMGGTMAIGLFAGTVSVTVTDAAGNSVSQSVTLTENPPLQAIANVTPILCHGGVATIALDASGGTMPYNGLSWYQFTAGTYNFTVADANGCRDQVTATIVEPPLLEVTAVAPNPILCHGDVTSVFVEATGGVGSYNGTGVYNEYAGTSYYSITDANGCYAYTSVTINQPQPLAATVNTTEIECRGGISEVTIGGIGGTSPYMGTGTINEVAGNYTYSIVDANGCQASSAVTITQPTALVATISNSPIACHGDLSAVEVLATGGVGPYTGPGVYYEQAGFHEYTVQDANGCWVDIATIVIEPTEIQLNVSWTPLVNGVSDVLVMASGGTPGYIGTGTYSVGPGLHVYTVYDNNGCGGSETITIADQSVTPMNSDAVVFEQNNNIRSGNELYEVSSVQGSFNTSNEQIEISYELKYDSEVSIEIYDMSGALVEFVEKDELSLKGENYLISIDSGKLTNGVYVYHFVTNVERQVGKLQIVQ